MPCNRLRRSDRPGRAGRSPTKRALWSLWIVSLAVTIVLTMATANAWAAISIDATTSANASKAAPSVSTPSFSTQAGGELLLAFVATDYISGSSTTVTSISGAGVDWTLVKRTNAQKGTAEIWRAFTATPLSNVTVTAALSQKVLSSITVVAYGGVDTSGTNGSGAIGATAGASASKGSPSAGLVTTRNGSWVFGVGNDYDNASPRTSDSGQSLVSQYLTSSGDTYWVQKQNGPTPLAGTAVKIDDTAPTTDRFNVAAVEVLPFAGSTGWMISGTITPASLGSGSQIALSQGGDHRGNRHGRWLGNLRLHEHPERQLQHHSEQERGLALAIVDGCDCQWSERYGRRLDATAQTASLSGNVSPRCQASAYR